MVCIRYRKSVKRALVKQQGRVGTYQGKAPKTDFFNPSRIADPIFKAAFDKNKTWIENGASCDLKALYESQLPESIPAKASWTIPKLNEDELSLIKRLVSKYGSNFAAMSRDRKGNTLQWTSDQCERKAKMAEEGRVHVCSEKCLCGTSASSSYVR